MKWILTVLLAMALLTGCGATQPSDASPESEPTEEHTAIAASEGVFNVTLTVPAGFVGDGMTQQECDNIAQEKGYKSVTLNADRSVEYVMSKAQHNDMMDEMSDTIRQGLSDMVTSGDFPNFVSIEPNEDFAEFKVVTKSDEVGLADSMATLGLYMYGGMYNAFNGTPTDNIAVLFVNEASGEVIREANLQDLKQNG